MFSADQEADSLVEFSTWKWRVLLRRREFFMPQLAAFNLFMWVYMSVGVFNHDDASVSLKGVVFTCTQFSGLLVLALLLTPKNKSMLKGNFGYKICILMGLSIFPFIYAVRKFTQTGLYFSETSGAIAASFMSAAWITSIHHIGLSEIFTWTMSVSLILNWCLYMDGSDRSINAPAYVAVVVSCLILSFCSSLLETEYRNMYALQNEAVERSLNDVTFIEDMAAVLRHMGRMLHRMGAGTPAAEPDLAHTEYLCASLFGAATQSAMDDNASHTSRSDVEVTRLCAGAISKMETVRGRACSTYYDPASAEVCVNTKRYFLEQILLLLCEDTNSPKVPPSFCLFSFQSVNGNLHITIKRTSIDVQQEGSGASTTKRDSTATELSDDFPDEEAFLQTLVAEKSQRHGVYDNARFRLADRIARKHLRSKVDMSTPESVHGLLRTSQRLVLPGPVSMPSVSRLDGADPSVFSLNPWYVVEYYKSTEDKLANVKYQLDALSIPWKSVHAYHFSSMKAKTQIAVVHEMWFRSHKDKVFEEVYRLAQAVILVSSDSDAPKSFTYTPHDGPARVIKVSSSVSTRDLFHAIQSLVAKLRPQTQLTPSGRGRLPPVALYQRQGSDISLGAGGGEGPMEGAQTAALRTVNSLEIASRPYGSEKKEEVVEDNEFLPLLLESEEDAEQMLEDSILQDRLRSIRPSLTTESDGFLFSPTASRSGDSSSHARPDPSGAAPEAEDPSLAAFKQKWTLLLDRLEFEVFVNRPHEAVRSLEMTHEEEEGADSRASLEKGVSALYRAALESIGEARMGGYELMAKNLVDVLHKQRTSKDKLWMFACLPYHQRVSKLIADEFIIALGEIRGQIKEGKCDLLQEQLARLVGKAETMQMHPLPCWLRVAADVGRVLVEHFPGGEPLALSSVGDIPTSAAPLAAASSRPSTARSMPSNESAAAAAASPAGRMPSAPFRSSANGLLAEQVASPNTEIRKILLNMLDLVEVNVWTILTNVLRLFDDNGE